LNRPGFLSLIFCGSYYGISPINNPGRAATFQYLGAHKLLKRVFAFYCSATAASDCAASDFMQTEKTPVIQFRNYSM
jgi:hypothetical protein